MLEIDDTARAAHRGTAIGAFRASGLGGRDPGPGLGPRRSEAEALLRKRWDGSSRDQIGSAEPFRAYRDYFARWGRTYPVILQVESVAVKGRSLAMGDPLLEAMFIAELESGVLTACHDVGAQLGRLRLSAATGAERFVLLGGKEKPIPAGDLILGDELGIVASVLLGPDDRTRVVPATSEALFVAYGPPGGGSPRVEEHLRDLGSCLRLACPACAVGEIWIAVA